MRKVFIAVLLLLVVFAASLEAQTNRPWRQHGSKYTLTTGGQVEDELIEHLRPFTDEDGNYFRCKMFWCYNGTTEVVYICRYKYDNQLQTDAEAILSDGVTWVDGYTWTNGTQCLPVYPGQTYISYVGFDGIYFNKQSVASMYEPFVWEAVR